MPIVTVAGFADNGREGIVRILLCELSFYGEFHGTVGVRALPWEAFNGTMGIWLYKMAAKTDA